MDISTSTGREVIPRFFVNRWVQILLRVGLGGFFLWAGILKVLEPQEFADNIAAYQILPYWIVKLAAISLPIFEMLVGGMLMIGFQIEVAAFSILTLSGIFSLAVLSAILRGLKIDCGCLGGGSPSVLKMWFVVGRDILFGAIAWLLYIQHSTIPAPQKKGLKASD